MVEGALVPEHERVEVPSEDVGLGGSDPAIGDASGTASDRRLMSADRAIFGVADDQLTPQRLRREQYAY